tara:strand:- start:254 stop:604 length:351 start_codon:yes stop_codon:yes gene_type:complete
MFNLGQMSPWAITYQVGMKGRRLEIPVNAPTTMRTLMEQCFRDDPGKQYYPQSIEAKRNFGKESLPVHVLTMVCLVLNRVVLNLYLQDMPTLPSTTILLTIILFHLQMLGLLSTLY